MAKTRIFLTKDVENVGMAGEVVRVADGFATNYLLARKLGVRVTDQNQGDFKKRIEKIEKREAVIKTKTSMLAERISSLDVTIKSKMHDDGKLYGAIRPQVIVDALADKGVAISKSMVVFDKPVKAKGAHMVTIKLSSSLKPKLSIKVVSE